MKGQRPDTNKLSDQDVCDYIVSCVEKMPQSYAKKHPVKAGLFGLGGGTKISALEREIKKIPGNQELMTSQKLQAMWEELTKDFEKNLRETLKLPQGRAILQDDYDAFIQKMNVESNDHHRGRMLGQVLQSIRIQHDYPAFNKVQQLTINNNYQLPLLEDQPKKRMGFIHKGG